MIKRFTSMQNIANNDISIEKRKIFGNYSVHYHEFYEIEYIISGSGEYTVDENTYQIRPGMIFFMTPLNFHKLKNVDAEIVNIMFTPNLSSPDALFSLSQPGIKYAVDVADSDRTFIEALLTELIRAADENDVIFASSLLNSLLFKLAKVSERNPSSKPAYIQKAALYLQDNFRSQITLDDIAKAVGLSPAYLSSIFAKNYGINLKKYLNDMRFQYAKKLLIFSDMNVGEICFSSGFNDYANFLRGFKQHYGVSPMKYKALHQISR